MPDKVVLFGAGATGRGHVGLLAWQAGCELVLVDKDPHLVSMLRDAGKYRVRLYRGEGDTAGGGSLEILVQGFSVFDANERDSVAREIADASLVLTAVFDHNLPDVAVTLARAVEVCMDAGRTDPLNVIACENMMDSSSTLAGHVHKRLTQEQGDYCSRVFAFPDCMISRVVPRPKPDPLLIITEDYNEWTVDARAYKGLRGINLPGFELVDDQAARLERKLFIHNGGHAVCGYMGYHYGHKYIHQAVADPRVVKVVSGALDELGEIVRRKHGFSADSIEAYKADLVRRGSIPEMADEILRVVRDPIRKLSARERLVAPALLAETYGIPRKWIVQGIVAALKYNHPEDEQSLKLTKMLTESGLPAVLRDVCSLSTSSKLGVEIQDAWQAWSV